MRKRTTIALVTGLALSGVVALGMSMASAAAGPKEQRFESVCQIVKRQIVEAEDNGTPRLVDLELEWDPCPGDQFQVVRGGKEFASCVMKYDVGELVPVKVLRYWDPRGYFSWDIYELGDCKRVVEPNAEGSFEKSQECTDTVAYGSAYGFRCDRRPKDKLVRVCPWTSRE